MDFLESTVSKERLEYFCANVAGFSKILPWRVCFAQNQRQRVTHRALSPKLAKMLTELGACHC